MKQINAKIIITQSILIFLLIISNVYFGMKTISDDKAVLSGYHYGSYSEIKKLKTYMGEKTYKNNYTGFISNNKLNGYGEHRIDNKLVYSGEFKNGLYDGLGVQYSEGMIKFVGEFKKGKREGRGVLFNDHKQVFFIGSYINNEVSGFGRCIGAYEGQYENGRRNGKGVLYNKSDLGFLSVFYDGRFNDNERTGNGIMMLGKFKIAEGMFDDGKLNGKGTTYHYGSKPPVIKYKGDFNKSKYHGYGMLYDKNGKIIYKGIFKNGKYISK